MNRENYQKAKKIFQSVIEIAPNGRNAFLEDACAGDQSLRRNVEILLHSFQSGFLEESAFSKIAEQILNSQIFVGQAVGRYKIQELVGAGGMGEVFLAEDISLNRKAAIKVLPVRFAGNGERVRRFIREARAASALNHPNILTIYEIGEENGLRYIASEFVVGETLRDRLKRGKLTLADTLEISLQIASALQAAHEAGIVHRDIKPENIMLRRDGLVKILDFGLAKLNENRTEEPGKVETPAYFSTQTVPGLLMGTTAYMSPEQARGRRVDGRTDIWSLGICLYEMLSGKLPFQGETTGDLIASILKTEITQVESSEIKIPAELQSVVCKALAKDLNERYLTDAEFIEDLRRVRKSLEISNELKETDELRRSQTIVEEAAIRETKENLSFDKKGYRRAAEARSGSKTERRKFAVPVFAIGLFLILGTGFGLYQLISTQAGFSKFAGYFRSSKNFTFASMKLNRLTNSGSAFGAAISPDGKYAAYQTVNNGKYSTWLMDIGTGNSVQITPPSEIVFNGITFSPGDDFIYYSTTDNQPNSVSSIYRMSRVGGEAKKILTGIDSPIGFFADGSRFAFIRSVPERGETSVVVANADGSSEQTIAVRKKPDSFSTGRRPAFSPDGKTIACIGINSGENFLRVFAVNVADGEVKPLTSEKWSALQDAIFLPNSDNLLITAQDDRNFGPSQIWKVSLSSGGAAEKITRELTTYNGLSLSLDANSFITTQTDSFNNIWILPDGNSNQAKQIFSNKGGGRVDMAWTRDNRILYTSNASGSPNIFIMNADGSNQIQLTTDTFVKRSPVVSPDNRYIVFISNQAGTEQIWRMDIDGQNQKQLTSVHTYRYPQFSPDGKWIIYTTWQDKKAFIWKVSIDSGESVLLKDGTAFTPNVSPDMKSIAYLDRDEQAGKTKIKIISFAGGELIKEFDVPQNTQPDSVRWKPDSSAVVYRCNRNGVFNIWLQKIKETEPQPLTNFKFDPPINCEWSLGGKDLSCARTTLVRDLVLFSGLY